MTSDGHHRGIYIEIIEIYLGRPTFQVAKTTRGTLASCARRLKTRFARFIVVVIFISTLRWLPRVNWPCAA